MASEHVSMTPVLSAFSCTFSVWTSAETHPLPPCRRKWDTTTDVMPINFFLPALLHVALVIAAIAAVVGRKDTCPDTSAHSAYQALRWGLFGLIVLSAAAELGIVFFGLQG